MKKSTKSSKAKPLSTDQEEALIALRTKLTELSREFPFRSFDISRINTSDDIELVKRFRDDCGMVFLTNATSGSSFEHAKQNYVRAFTEMFKYDLTDDQLAQVDIDDVNSINQFRSPKFGAGNASFAYLNKQYTELSGTFNTLIDGDNTYLALNSVHSMVNLPLLTENPHTAAVLMACTHPKGMISWDSAKYASNPKPKPKDMTKQDLTKFHFDKYGGGGIGQRVQVIIVHEGAVKLGYVPFTHRSDVQALIRKSLSKPKLYDREGFIGTNEPYLTAVLQDFMVAPDTNSMVIWSETVIHAEAQFNTPNPLGYCTFKSRKDVANSERFRFVVGMHQPVGLSDAALVKLASLCEGNLIPDFYFSHNKGTKVWDNIKNGKSTQYKQPRVISKREREDANDVIEKADKDTLEAMPPLKKHLYGISQPLDQLGFTDKDQEMLGKFM